MIFDAGDRAPRMIETRRVKRIPYRGDRNRCLGSAGRRADSVAQRTAQAVMLHHVEACSAGRSGRNDRQRR